MAAETHCRVSGVWQKIKEVHVRVSGVWQKCKEVWTRVSGVWQKVYVNATIPAGGMLFWASTGAVPAGFTALVSGYNGYNVRGMSAGATPFGTGGATSKAFSTGSTAGGAHTGVAWSSAGGSGGHGTASQGNHTHTCAYTLSTLPLAIRSCMIIASAETAQVPALAWALTHKTLGTAGGVEDSSNIAHQWTSVSAYILQHNATTSTAGSGTGTNAPTTSATTPSPGNHNHGGNQGRFQDAGGDGNSGSTRNRGQSAGGHTHTNTVYGTLSTLKKYMLMIGNSSAAWDARPGMIIGWNNTTASIPAGWVLCDGANGTPDLRNYFIAPATTGNVNTTNGSNTISATATLASNGSHTHISGSVSNTASGAGYHHTGYGAHTHTISSGSLAHTCLYFQIAFIMKTSG